MNVACLVFSNEKRERGNYLYARNDCIRAINVYEKYVCTVTTSALVKILWRLKL